MDGNAANVGRETSLAVIGGLPAIAYQSPNTGEILYAWAADAEGTSWPAADRIAIEGSLAAYRQHPCLAEVGGKPAIAFYNQTDGDLRYAWLSGSDPSLLGDWTVVDVATAGNVGNRPALAVIGGLPAIACDDAAGTVAFAMATDATGAAWNPPVTIDAGAEASLADLGGVPGVSYYATASGDLKLAIAGDATGLTWPVASRLVIDGALANVGTHSSLARVAGLPAIAYHDESGTALKFAALPVATWSAAAGGAAPILASGVKDSAVTAAMLGAEVGVWQTSGEDLLHLGGKVGIGRVPLANSLEVEGSASKSVAGSWAANSDRRIKTGIRDIGHAIESTRYLSPSLASPLSIASRDSGARFQPFGRHRRARTKAQPSGAPEPARIRRGLNAGFIQKPPMVRPCWCGGVRGMGYGDAAKRRPSLPARSTLSADAVEPGLGFA